MIFMDGNTSAFFDAQIDKLRLLRQTARGEVWLALWKPARAVVWKRIHATGLPYALLAEHPHLLWPTVLCCSEDGTDTVVVEEYAEGEPLSARLSAKRFLEEREAAEILTQLCDGLAVLHGLGIVHRDIKPSNLILQNGTIRLIDFDVARTIKDEQPEDTALLGTKGYAPPEQFGYGQTDARSDIYAVGVTLAKLLGPDYRGWLSPILEKCTELDPKRRYGSAAELKRAVLMRRRWAKAKIACPLVLAAFVGAMFYLFPSHPSPPTETPPFPTEDVKPVVEESASPASKEAGRMETKAGLETEAVIPKIAQMETEDTVEDMEKDMVTGNANEPSALVDPSDAQVAEIDTIEDFLALFKDDPEKLAYWTIRRQPVVDDYFRKTATPEEWRIAEQEQLDIMKRGELGLRVESFRASLPKNMTSDERGRAINAFVAEQVKLLGITDFW